MALFPCNECAKSIIQAGISEVIYLSDKYANTPGTRMSKRMLNAAGVQLRQLEPSREELTLNFRAEPKRVELK